MTTFTTQDRQDAQRAPLTEEQCMEIYKQTQEYVDQCWEIAKHKYFPIEIARAIERAHGIGE